MKKILISFIFCLILVLLGCEAFSSNTYKANFISLTKGWNFKTDPQEVGQKQGWFKLEFKDSDWKSINAGINWEECGFPNYDGVVWYRKTVYIPDTWNGEKIIIGFGGVDDLYTLYVNGKEVASHGSLTRKESVWDRPTQTDITNYVIKGKYNLISLMVTDWGGGGGLARLPCAISADIFSLLPTRDYAHYLVERHPDWIMPGWLRGSGTAWTICGMAGGYSEALMSTTGTFQPYNRSFSVEFWVYDTQTNQFYFPKQKDVTCNMEEGYMPMPCASWKTDEIGIECSYFTWGNSNSDSDAVSFARVSLSNLSTKNKSLRLYMAIRPYAINGSINEIHSLQQMENDSRAILVNDKISIVCDCEPSGLGVVRLELADISQWALQGKLPSDKKGTDERGMLTGTLIFDLNLQPASTATRGFKLPMNPFDPSAEDKIGAIKKMDILENKQRATEFWREKLNKVGFLLPDKKMFDCYRASLAYILIAMDGNMLHPGPLNYDNFWYRDGSYMVAALMRAGLFDVSREVLKFFAEMQQPNGGFPSIVSSARQCVGPPEWDSQGQAIFALTEYYRFTHDQPWLESVFPTIRKGCEFIQSLRSQHLTPEYKDGTPEKQVVYGLLPPSWSAEDLGSADWHHYWDDLWAIRGLRDAAWTARELGKNKDAEWFEKEAQSHYTSLLNSFAAVCALKKIDYIPNSIDDITGSSMARGTSPGIWPGNILDKTDSLVKRSFNTYWEKWIQPYGGGYFHQGQVWPYGMELATCYVMLGEKEKAWTILNWHLDHQTTSGTYAWAEQINLQNKTYGGDMPHCWVAGDYMNLLRTMLLYEDGNKMVLAAGIPQPWLATKQKIGAVNVPTYFGRLSYEIEPRPEEHSYVLRVTTGRDFKGDIVFKSPAGEQTASAVMDGSPLEVLSNGEMNIPTGEHLIEVRIRTVEKGK